MERMISETKHNKISDVFSSETVHLEMHDLGRRRRRQIHRVPLQLQRRKEMRSPYDPMVMSLGPYHHGKPELHAAEEVKRRFLDRLTRSSHTGKNMLYEMVLEKIDEIRGCYADDTCTSKYDDMTLAMMMLLDASFIVALIKGLSGQRDIFLDWHQCLGLATLQFTIPDIMLLENQIPLNIIKLILSLQRGEGDEEEEELISKFLNWLLSADFIAQTTCIIAKESDEEHPLHILEGCHRILTSEEDYSSLKKEQQRATISGFKFTKQEGFCIDRTARSATDLKAKGIEFKSSSSCSIRAVKFRSWGLKGELRLPVRVVWFNSFIATSNLIAYEMSPASNCEFEVLSYMNLIKSLVESSEDAKELQEKGILINMFQNNQQLVNEVKGLDTFGLDNFDMFKDVKMEIEEHCRSKAKTWIADLVHTRFSSPWSIAALLAATFLLCLTFLQTYFTINPCINK